MGTSIDHVPCLKAWAKDIGGIGYPLAADFWPHGEIARRYGVFRDADGYDERTIIVIDQSGIVRYVDVHPIDDLPDIEIVFSELAKFAPREPVTRDHGGAGGAMGGVTGGGAGGVSPQQGARAAAQPAGAPSAIAQAQRPHPVLYCRSWCFDCNRAERWLEAEGVDYTLVDIDKTPEAADRLTYLAGKIVTPTFEIGDTVIVGFDPPKLADILR